MRRGQDQPYTSHHIFNLSPTFLTMLVAALTAIGCFWVDAHAKSPPPDKENPYFKEDREKRERWAQEANERKERGEPPSRENSYFKEDKEKREGWAQEAKERRERGEPPLKENPYFKEDREKRESWKHG